MMLLALMRIRVESPLSSSLPIPANPTFALAEDPTGDVTNPCC